MRGPLINAQSPLHNRGGQQILRKTVPIGQMQGLTCGGAVQMEKEMHGSRSDDAAMQRDAYLNPVFSFNDKDHQELLEAANNIDLILKKERSEEHLMPEVASPLTPGRIPQFWGPTCLHMLRTNLGGVQLRRRCSPSSNWRLHCMYVGVTSLLRPAACCERVRMCVQLPDEVDEDEMHPGSTAHSTHGSGNKSFLPTFGKGKKGSNAADKDVQMSTTEVGCSQQRCAQSCAAGRVRTSLSLQRICH